MPVAVIDNPILNSPFREPTRHFRFGDEGMTSEVVEERRESAYFMPIPAAKKRSQIHFDTEWTRDRIEENRFINRVRGKVDLWRRGGWQGVTPTTRRLLEHWTDPDPDPDPERQRRLFFCRSRPSRRLSTSPRRPRSSTTPGSPTSCASSPTTPTRVS
jgi:type III restriction enzyme